jgi:hypothetical protein
MIKPFPKPWPWNKLPNPTPADWGIGMTVCIAAICEPTVDDEYIVVVSDRMVSMGGYFSADDIVRKVDPAGYGWTSMIAGNDVSPAVPILKRVKEGMAMEPYYDSQKGMVDIFKDAYKQQRLEQIEDEILSPLGFTWDTFRNDARVQLPERVYERIVDRIRQYELDLTFLISGFDDKGVSHIFTVSNPGKCDYYEKLGFWAIGSGQHQAVASMFANHYSRHDRLEGCTAKVLTAKLIAESALGVGKRTWLMVVSAKIRHKSMFISSETVDAFRKEWKTLPRLPIGGVAAISANLTSEIKRIADNEKRLAEAAKPSDDQTSEDQR